MFGGMMKLFFSACVAALAFCLVSPQTVVAQGPPPIFGFTNKKNIPAPGKSGSPIYEKLRSEATKKKLPLVIYVTGSKWCAKCNVCTNVYIKKPEFKAATGKKFMFWMVDTEQKVGARPGTFKFVMVPAEAAKVVGCIDNQKAPYVIFGPPAVLIIDPVSGELIKSLPGKSEIDRYKKPLETIISDTWKEFSAKQKKK